MLAIQMSGHEECGLAEDELLIGVTIRIAKKVRNLVLFPNMEDLQRPPTAEAEPLEEAVTPVNTRTTSEFLKAI